MKLNSNIFYIIVLIPVLMLGFYFRFVVAENSFYINDLDSIYHLRRVFIALNNNFSISGVDLFRDLNQNELCIWPRYYDLLLAVFAYIFILINNSHDKIENFLSILPSIAGTITIFSIFLISKKYGYLWGILAAIIQCFIPEQVYISRRGYIDHHAFEILMFSLVNFFVYNYLEKKSNTSFFASIATIALLFLTWGGSTLYIAIFGAGLLIFSLKNKEHLIPVSKIFMYSGLVILPFYVLNYGYFILDFRYDRPSLFQPLMIIEGGLLLKIISGYFEKKIYNWKFVTLFITILFVCIFQVAQGFSFLFGDGGGYKYVNFVVELQPLYKSDPLEMITALGALAFFTPLMAIFIINNSIRENRVTEYIISFNFIVFLIIAVFSKRYLAVTSLFLAPLIIFFILELNKKLKRKYVWIVLSSLILIVTIAPISFASYNLTTMKSYGDSNIFSSYNDPDIYSLFEWLNKNTPKPKNPFNPDENIGYTVMAQWGYGHYLTMRAERPCVADPFGTNTDIPSKIFFSKNENEAFKLLKQHKSKYIIISSDVFFSEKTNFGLINKTNVNWLSVRSFNYKNKIYKAGFPGDDLTDTIFENLYIFKGKGSKELGIFPLKHFKLVYESTKKENFYIMKNVTGETKYIMLGNIYPKEFRMVISNPSSYKVFEVLY